MRSKQQRFRAYKIDLANAHKHLIREQELASRAYAHARKLYSEGYLTTYTQGLAAEQYRNVRLAQNRLQRLIDGKLMWSYSELGFNDK